MNRFWVFIPVCLALRDTAHIYVFMALNVIKLIVGCDTLDEYAAWQAQEVMDYHGQPAVPCWTRFMPKRGDERFTRGGAVARGR